MIYDIDRVNDMLAKAKLPSVCATDMRGRAPTDRGHFSLVALGLNRLESHYRMPGLDDWAKARMRTPKHFRQQVPMTIGERIRALEAYQSLCADPAHPIFIQRNA